MFNKESTTIEVQENLKYLRNILDNVEKLLNKKQDHDIIVSLIFTQKLIHDVHYGEFNCELINELLNNMEKI